ncbi:MAG: YokU family protein [Bacillaceae bacterium]|nr:YokU family protein [Bacillaceae bacterium]
MNCEWCQSKEIKETSSTVHWELPDGTRAITIEDTPAIQCLECGMEYQTEQTIKEIEDQLFLINTKQLEDVTSYQTLLAQPRLLKRNYFDF